MLLTDTGMYIKYNKVKGKIKPILDVKTTINDFHIGYELPDIGKIQNITADGREIDFKQYQ
jgi:metal-sulfur cluster biosynthetic enzyme